MKNFWPYRSDAKGFSIENFASKYREKVSRFSFEKKTSQLLDKRELKSLKEERVNRVLSDLSLKKGHWANRDFSEYKEVA